MTDHTAFNDPTLAVEALTGMAMFAASAVFVLTIYFLPTLIGRKRGIEFQILMFGLNGLFAWTVIGWAMLLLWAVLAQSGDQRRFYANAGR